MRVTIRQIAEISGVSRSTVDKVLNNRLGVSDEVRQKVKSIADGLGYEPNMIGKALAFQNKPMVIAVVIPDSDFGKEVKIGVNKAYEALKDYGIKVESYITKDYDVTEQISVMNYLIDRKVSGIVLRPYEDIRIKEIIDKVAENNIAVVTYNSDVALSRRLCFVGQDLVKSGRVAANIMAKLLNGIGKVAIIMGSYDLSALNQRLEGFKTVIESQYPMIEIVDIIETKEQKILTFQKTMSLLEVVEDLSGIYITGGPVSEVGKAVKFMGKSGKVKIVSFDFYPEIVELVKEGVIDFTIGQDPVAQGYKPVKILFEYLFSGKQPEADHIKTTIDIREKESINIID